MATIDQRQTKDGRTIYRVRIRRTGRKLITASFYSKTLAKQYVAQTEHDINAKRYLRHAESSKHTLGDAIDRYIEKELPKKPKCIGQQKAQLLWFKEKIGFMFLAEISPAVLMQVKEDLLDEVSGATVNRYLAALSCVYRIASSAWMLCEDNPVRKIPREKEADGIVRYLSETERQNLLKECKADSNPNLYPLVVVALATGMRKGEVLYLKWRDVDLDRGVIFLQGTKNGERRRVPLRAHPLEVLKAHSKVRRIDTDFVFPGPLTAKTGRPFELRPPWEAALIRAEISKFRFHDLRHSCASYLAMNGASLLEIAEVLGHKTLQMVKRYSHLAESHTGGVVERMNQAIFKE